MQQKRKNIKFFISQEMGFFNLLRSLHNGVENPVEKVENPDELKVYPGGDRIMGKITQ